MRYLKFRIWNSDSKELYDVRELTWVNGKILFYEDEEANYTLMQYTGFKDKNGKGKEIYDKDCFETASGICVVEWITDGWFVLWEDGSIQRLLEFLTEGSTPKHITGNVYESPTLYQKALDEVGKIYYRFSTGEITLREFADELTKLRET